MQSTKLIEDNAGNYLYNKKSELMKFICQTIRERKENLFSVHQQNKTKNDNRKNYISNIEMKPLKLRLVTLVTLMFKVRQQKRKTRYSKRTY